MQDAPTIMANEEKTVKDSEGDRVVPRHNSKRL
jgi:hypothetical protein